MMSRVVKHISQTTNFRKQFTRSLTPEPLISARKSVFPEQTHCPEKSVESRLDYEWEERCFLFPSFWFSLQIPPECLSCQALSRHGAFCGQWVPLSMVMWLVRWWDAQNIAQAIPIWWVRSCVGSGCLALWKQIFPGCSGVSEINSVLLFSW